MTKRSGEKKRVLILGLDGGTFEVFNPLMERGLMPNLKNLVQNGSSSNLDSIIPPLTGPAWSAIVTGKNPGKTGVYGFLKTAKQGVGLRPVRASDVAAETFWSFASRHGLKVGVFNVPITYPPLKVNGFMISGMLTPSVESDFIYPKNLREELLEHTGQLILDTPWTKYGDDIEGLLDHLVQTHLQRREATLYLMNHKEWDLFMVVFTGTDRIQHALWDHIEPEQHENLPGSEQHVRSRVAEFYKEVDATIGKIVEALNEDTALLVISDHGFGRMHKRVYLNSWLKEEGFLAINRSFFVSARIKALSRAVLLRASRRFGLSSKTKRRARLRAQRTTRAFQARITTMLRAIDWTRTRAYASPVTGHAGIRINLKGRESHGSVAESDYEKIRDDVIEKLKAWKDPDTGKPTASRIMKREEYYSGPYLDDAPDILLLPNDYKYWIEIGFHRKIFEAPRKHYGRGSHRMNGIFVAHGRPIKQGVSPQASLLDVCPTVLYLLGLPVPEDMDGRVLEELFDAAHLKSHPIQKTKSQDSKHAPAAQAEDEETQEILERLRDLGYLS